MKADLSKLLANKRLYFDGGTGTVLSSRGLPAGMPPALWSLQNPREVLALCRAYIDAGADIIKTNTFGVTSLAYPNADELISAALAVAKEARGRGDTLIAFDIGPSGRLLKPYGDLDFEDAASAFGEAAQIAALGIVERLRREGVYAECDIVGRSLKAQMKYANKLGAAYTLIIGDDEIDRGSAQLRNMADGTQREVELDSFEL
jgi:methionine synthase I (cobalamin-dependent)